MRTERWASLVLAGLCGLACAANDGNEASGGADDDTGDDGGDDDDDDEDDDAAPTSAASGTTRADDDTGDDDDDDDDVDDTGDDDDDDDDVDTGDTGEPGDTGDTGEQPLSFTAVTFNVGGHANGQDDVADEHYGNGLAWIPAVEQTTAYLAALSPEVIVFQEVFHAPDCAEIPEEFHSGYICETWQPGDPTVAQMILGDGYQVACHLGKPDKCAAVKTSFGSFAGCDEDFCLEGLDGGQVEDCGGGSRVGRGVIELVDGGELTIVNFHGTSGFLPDDQLCRVAQVEQVFIDLLDENGEPGANGNRNLVLGDFNTDPARAVLLDFSAARWNDFVGDDHPFHFITDVGPDVLPTYANTINIDHQVSDSFVGSCSHPGITPGEDAVVDFSYYDHVPAVCTLTEG